MAATIMNAVNVAPWIPEIWGKIIQVATEAELVFAPHVDRRFEAELTYGDTVRIPILADFGAANAVITTQDIELYNTAQTCTQVVVNYWYQKSVGLAEQEEIQDHPDFLISALKKCGYAVSKNIDSALATLVNSTFTTYGEGTQNSALTADVLINCYEDLNAADAPASDRVWIFDPESITDLLKLDYFIRYDYVPEGVVAKGFQGRQIFGAPVYMTTNLNGFANSHEATYMHKEGLVLLQQKAPTVHAFDWPERFSKVVGVSSLYGVLGARATFGVCICTRG